MNPRFHITRVDAQHVVLFSAESLEAVAESLAAQPNPEALAVYSTIDGFSRDLDADERHRLEELMRASVG